MSNAPGARPAIRVAITGIGWVTPLGSSLSAVWKAIQEGRSATRRIVSFDPSDYPSQVAAEVLEFDPCQYLSAKTVRRTGRATHFALAAAAEAREDAGWSAPGDDFSDAATILGSGCGSMPSVEEAYRVFYTEGWKKNPFLAVPMCMPNAPGSQVAIEHRLTGPSYTVAAACASGAAAIGEAFRLIRTGVIRRALSGGVDAIILPGMYSIWCLLGVMSRRNHDPAGAAAPFSADRDGLVLGEGACVLTLERLDEAERRGARIYAEVVGVGSNCGADSITAPNLEAEVAAMRGALADGGLVAEEIGYINAHGTATRLNDAMESRAIHEVFAGRASSSGLPVSSTKSMIGHTVGASAAIECAVTALALRDQVLPPTVNLRQPDPECALDCVPGKARPASFEAALSNSFAFGGTNVILALRRYGG